MIKIAKYTIELRHLRDNLFDFDYPYYEPEAKCYFEEKFIEHYYFNEIGFETIARFKQQLRAYLLRIAPYYLQRYQVELRCLKPDIDFMMNKDLKETFLRELEGNENNNFNGNDSSTSISTDINSSLNLLKESNLADGVSSSQIEDGYLTSSSQNEDNSSNKSNATNNSTTSNNSNRNNNETEKTELISKGNIGITSSAELKEKWVKVLYNLDEEIILGARNLFMMVY